MHTAVLAELLCVSDPGWDQETHADLARCVLASLGDAIGAQLVALDYSGVENPKDQRTTDFLWVRFRDTTFSNPSILVSVAGAVAVSRVKRTAEGFLQYFVLNEPVRLMSQSEMLGIDFQVEGKRQWELEWQGHDFVEEYDQYTYDYFSSLGELTAFNRRADA